jgi:hypothetical protein
MQFGLRRSTVIAIATVGALVVTAGTASAYWQTSGAGQGSARTAIPDFLTIDPGTPTTALSPGHTSDVSVVIGNTTDSPVLVTSVTTPTGVVPGFSDPDLFELVNSCDATHSDVTIVRTTPRPASFVIAPNASYTLTLANAVTMGSNSDNSCQGLFFAVPVTVQAHTAAGTTPSTPAAGTL